MAKSWSGFAPQNELIKAQWTVLEAASPQVAGWLNSVQPEETGAEETPAEEEPIPFPLKPEDT